MNALQTHPEIILSSVSPASVEFKEEDGFVEDTLVTFQIEARLTEEPEPGKAYQIVASLASAQTRTVLTADTLKPVPNNPAAFEGTLTHPLSTLDFENLTLYVYPLLSSIMAGPRAETTIKVRGIQSGEPGVLEALHKDVVSIPSSGDPAKNFFIAAKVTHTLSIQLINEVRLDLYREEEERIRLGSYAMADEDAAYGNTSGDSIYVQGFLIDSSSIPGTYSAEIYATDTRGIRSDTLHTSFVFSE